MNYLKELEEYLLKQKIVEVETLTIKDDPAPLGTKGKEAEDMEIPEDGEDLTVSKARLIGSKPKKSISIRAKKVVDESTSKHGARYVWDPKKKIFTRRT